VAENAAAFHSSGVPVTATNHDFERSHFFYGLLYQFLVCCVNSKPCLSASRQPRFVRSLAILFTGRLLPHTDVLALLMPLLFPYAVCRNSTRSWDPGVRERADATHR
jgi:hypothetical protein